MATIDKRKSRGKTVYRVQVRKKGWPDQVKTFALRKDAEKWARNVETQMDMGTFVDPRAADGMTVDLLLESYADYVRQSPRFRSKVKDLGMIRRLRSRKLARYSLTGLTPAALAKYRDERLKQVEPQTVIHELNMLSRAFSYAELELHLPIPRGNPVKAISKPQLPPPRERRLAPGEEERLLEAAKDYGGDIHDVIVLAIETAMREGELGGMTWDHVHLADRYVHLTKTKNSSPRNVPLSSRALGILRARCPDDPLPGERVWAFGGDRIAHLFPEIASLAGSSNLRFHDLRHEATSRLVKKGFQIHELAKITGHKTLKMLMRYYHPRPEDFAERLG